MKGYIHSVETFGAVDGPGIRYVIFLQGCPYRCIFCHNPDSWKMKEGKRTSVKQVVKGILPYVNYIEGVTISGGEPLLQSKFVLKLIKRIHKLGLTVAIDTAGSVPLRVSQKVLEKCDLVLMDIKGLSDNLNKTITGFSNKYPQQTLKYLEQISKPVWIRQVVVPGYTLSTKYLTELAKFLRTLKCVENIDLLPFHKMGEYKWKDMGLDYKLYNTPAPTKEQMEKARGIFEKYKLPITK